MQTGRFRMMEHLGVTEDIISSVIEMYTNIVDQHITYPSVSHGF